MNSNHAIGIIIDTKRARLKKDALRNAVKKTLEFEGIKNKVSVNLLFTDNKKIRQLNRKFLNKNRPTDVIAFGGGRSGFIGEIAVSTQMAEYNAERFNTSKEKEILLYIIHGILHLLGYGDETERGKKVMDKRQEKILKALEAACSTS